MKTYYLLTAFGKDRPGIVAHTAGVVFRLGGNIEDASMTRLGGEFAMMLVAGFSGRTAGVKFVKSLPAFQRPWGLQLNAKPITQALAHARRQVQPTHLISVYGTDKPGIVFRVAQTLASRRINITDLNTKVLQRSGKSLYVMLLEVHISSRGAAAALQRNLKTLGRRLRLDVTLQEVAPVSL